MAVVCPECDSPIDMEEEVDQGETVQCEECGAEREVVSIDPIELAAVEEAGYDDDDTTQLTGEEEE
jgi:alpha-aminoadipate/glutamate carrier protein LysW